MGSSARTNTTPEAGHPCRTPRPRRMHPCLAPPRTTSASPPSYRHLRKRMTKVGTPALASTAKIHE
eukprot:8059608-Lingulodinium_polyedra.AAC.1